MSFIMRFIMTFLILVGIARCQLPDPVCLDNVTLTNVTKNVSNSESGPANNGYYYEVWTNSPGGDSKIMLYDEDAAFKADWDDPDDFLGRVGARWPSRNGLEYPAYGNMVAEYAYTRSGEKTAGPRYNFIGIYGWAYDNEVKGIPLVEYYIIDDWFGNDEFNETDPIPESTACHDSEPGWVCQKGSFNVDGGDYKIYTNWRVNKPSIIGDTTFLQYFSIRQQFRKCGKITISEHFKKWNSLNLRLGNLFEASLLVEVQEGKGFIDFTHAKVLTNVPNSDLGFTPVNYAPACPDRTPNAGSCGDSLDGADAPPCYLQPDNKCGPSCPVDYEPGTAANAGKCVAKTYSTNQQCVDRSVQRSGCKDGAYANASCAQFGCGPSCYLNVKHTKCSLACDQSAGEVAAAAGTGKYCQLPCSERTPQTVTAPANFDVIISVKDVLFKFGWKEDATVKFTINGETRTSTKLVGTGAIFTINEELNWTSVAPEKLASVSFSIQNQYNIGSGTIDISDIVYKVGSIAEGIDGSFTYLDPTGPMAQYSNTFTINYKVAVIYPSSDWGCEFPASPACHLEGDKCASETVPGGDESSSSFARAASWGCLALCLLIVVFVL